MATGDLTTTASSRGAPTPRTANRRRGPPMWPRGWTSHSPRRLRQRRPRRPKHGADATAAAGAVRLRRWRRRLAVSREAGLFVSSAARRPTALTPICCGAVAKGCDGRAPEGRARARAPNNKACGFGRRDSSQNGSWTARACISELPGCRSLRACKLGRASGRGQVPNRPGPGCARCLCAPAGPPESLALSPGSAPPPFNPDNLGNAQAMPKTTPATCGACHERMPAECMPNQSPVLGRRLLRNYSEHFRTFLPEA